MKKKVLILFTIAMLIAAGCGKSRPASSISKDAEATSVSEGVSVSEEQTENKLSKDLPKAVATSFPDGGWQINTQFPDWCDYVDDTLAMNSMISFKTYEGQGKIYLSPAESVSDFTVYVNETKIDTSDCVGGGCYVADISDIVHTGRNTVQITGISPRKDSAKVCVSIPYPEVTAGTIEEEGISADSLDLISDLINSDVKNGFASASLAVVRNGKLVYENAWGSVNTYEQDGSRIQNPVPATKDTLYDLASVTKMFSVNYAIQKLVSDGTISVNDRISKYLGDSFYNDVISVSYRGRSQVSIDTQKKWKSELTIRDLLCHQGGFPADPKYFHPDVNQVTQSAGNPGANVLFAGNSADEATKANTLLQIFRTPLLYEPGTETLYSDVDYMVLGFVVEEVTGKDLNTYLKETFWNPMGLSRITYNPLQNGFTANDCAATELNGNTRDGGVYFQGIRTYTLQGEVHDEKAYYCMGGVSGHAGLFASAGDLAKLGSVMLTGGYGNNRYFSLDTIDSFTSPKSSDFPTWGLGWWREADSERVWYFGTQSGSDTVGHQGWTGTLVMIDPSRELVVVYLTNKINTRLTDISKNLNRFNGSSYTSATLGFVPQILSIGMDSNEDVKEQLLDLAADMAVESVKLIPGGTVKGEPIARSAKAKIDLLNLRMEKLDSDKYKELADELYQEIEFLLPEDTENVPATNTRPETDPVSDNKEENTGNEEPAPEVQVKSVKLGDECIDDFLPKLSGKKVAVFTNQTGIVGDDLDAGVHIVDALIEKGVNVTAVFAPEHGFRGDLDAGEKVGDSVDEKTGLNIYGAAVSDLGSISKKRMDQFDVLMVDIQDVGVRYYTYYLSMYYLMQACAAYDKEVVILDRPNPNGNYVDGPVLKEEFKSNVGILSIPVVHGMTLGELAKMFNGEGWAQLNGKTCKLTVIPCKNYTHADKYTIKVNPSPNLKSMNAIYLYPSTCYFENTAVSCGRGTDNPFAIFGSPYLPDNAYYNYSFIPEDKPGATDPLFEGKLCFGIDLSYADEDEIRSKGIDLDYVIKAYQDMHSLHPEISFFGSSDAKGRYWIDLLMGTDSVRNMIEQGYDSYTIKQSWAEELDNFNRIRSKYLIYP